MTTSSCRFKLRIYIIFDSQANTQCKYNKSASQYEWLSERSGIRHNSIPFSLNNCTNRFHFFFSTNHFKQKCRMEKFRAKIRFSMKVHHNIISKRKIGSVLRHRIPLTRSHWMRACARVPCVGHHCRGCQIICTDHRRRVNNSFGRINT